MNKVVQNALILVMFFNKAGTFQTDCIYLTGGPLHCGLKVYNKFGGLAWDMIIRTHIVKQKTKKPKKHGFESGLTGFESLLPFMLPGPLSVSGHPVLVEFPYLKKSEEQCLSQWEVTCGNKSKSCWWGVWALGLSLSG